MNASVVERYCAAPQSALRSGRRDADLVFFAVEKVREVARSSGKTGAQHDGSVGVLHRAVAATIDRRGVVPHAVDINLHPGRRSAAIVGREYVMPTGRERRTRIFADEARQTVIVVQYESEKPPGANPNGPLSLLLSSRLERLTRQRILDRRVRAHPEGERKRTVVDVVCKAQRIVVDHVDIVVHTVEIERAIYLTRDLSRGVHVVGRSMVAEARAVPDVVSPTVDVGLSEMPDGAVAIAPNILLICEGLLVYGRWIVVVQPDVVDL